MIVKVAKFLYVWIFPLLFALLTFLYLESNPQVQARMDFELTKKSQGQFFWIAESNPSRNLEFTEKDSQRFEVLPGRQSYQINIPADVYLLRLDPTIDEDLLKMYEISITYLRVPVLGWMDPKILSDLWLPKSNLKREGQDGHWKTTGNDPYFVSRTFYGCRLRVTLINGSLSFLIFIALLLLSHLLFRKILPVSVRKREVSSNEPAKRSAQVIGSSILILFSFGCAELTLSLVGYRYHPMSIRAEDSSISDWRNHHVFKDEAFEFDPLLIWRPRPNHSVFNEQGFRGPVLEMKPSQQPELIATIGDSNTLGLASGEPGWPEYLIEDLKLKNPDYKLINAGAWGYTSFQGVYRMRETLKFRPKIVFISFGANDAHSVLVADKDYLQFKYLPFSWISSLRISGLVFALRDQLRLKSTTALEFTRRVTETDFVENLKQMIGDAQRASAKPVLLTRPFKMVTVTPLDALNFVADYNRLTKDVAKNAGVQLIDVECSTRNHPDFFADAVHFNDQGFRAASQYISKGLQEEVSAIKLCPY